MTVRQDQASRIDSSSSPSSSQAQGSSAAQQQQQQPKSFKRPKSVAQWTVFDVQKWFRRHCGDYYHLYSVTFLDQDITGRSLVRLNENSLLRMGIAHPEHRQDILREIAKLRLRTNILLLRDLERRQQQQQPQQQQQHHQDQKSPLV